MGRRASVRQADQQSHLVITSTSRNSESVCIVVSSEVPEEVRREIQKLDFRGLGWKVSRCCSSAINPGMTHYVVCTPDRHLRGHRGRAVCPKRSLSLLKAIVMEKWIVTYDCEFRWGNTKLMGGRPTRRTRSLIPSGAHYHFQRLEACAT